MENMLDKWYQNLTYTEAKDILQEKLMNIKMNFIAAGYYLKYIRDNKLYLEEGYKSIWEFAENKYGIQRTTASRWMLMNDRYSVDGNSPILIKEYRVFGKSQLQEMLYLEDEQMEQVTPDMTVKDIRKLREEPGEEPVSILGYPLRVYPEDSLISIPGCGKQDCFSCHRDGCELRQVECWCVEAPCGNPFPCTTMDVVGNLREEIGEKCQFVNNDLADHRAGDGEPVPCCKKCAEPCALACDRAIRAMSEREERGNGKMCDVAHDGKCIHRPEFSCTLPESSKLAIGDGVDCYEKCCWDCPKRGDCGYRCNSASGHPVRSAEEQLPGQMFVEDYPELLPEEQKSNSKIDNDENNIVDEQSEAVVDAEYKEVAAGNADNAEIYRPKATNLDELTFSELAIREYLEDEERTLTEYVQCDQQEKGFPENVLMKQKMLVKALRLLLESEVAWDDQNDSDEPEELEPAQLELPVLRNNDQRKEWLNNYKAWGLWYRDKNVDVNYYKYDFSDGSRLVVAEYPQRRRYWNPKELVDEHYYHLLEKNRKYYGSDKTFEQPYMHSTDSETYLVEFLKNLQKGVKK